MQGGWQMAVFSLLPLVICLLSPAPASAQTLFGPQQYTLTSGTPQSFSAVVSTSAGPAHLHVVNGAPDGSARLSHASISLNGVEVVGPDDLGADVALVDKPVLLFSNNVLSVTLSGPVGGTLEVTLERRSASLTSVTPSSGRQGETVSVTVVGSNTHFAPGTTLLWAGRGISVGGAPPGAFGPVTVQDGTHLTATLTIGPSIILGPRLLLAKTNGERAALFPGVTVLAGTPAIAGTTVTTLAGTGTPGLVDGAGSTAQFRFPADVAPRADGSAVVADTANSRLRALAPDGTTTTVSLPVSLLLPAGVALDASGRTVIADTARCVIRIVNPDGTVTTIGSAFSCTFADGPAGTARFRFPRDVVSDAAGNLYVADAGNRRVRKVDPQGTVTTLAGTGAFGGADGPGSTATFGLLTGIAVAEQPQGPPVVLVSDAVFHRLRQIAPDGTVTTVAGTGVPGFAAGPAASAQFAFPTRLTRDPAGHLYVADTVNNLIRRLTPQGTVETVAGTGAWGSQDGPGAAATFTLPVGVGLASASPSTLFVVDTFSHKIRVIQVGAPPTITALDPTSAVQGDTLTLTVTGTNLSEATALTFNPETDPPDITVTDLQVSPGGTQLTAAVSLALIALPGPRVVTVTTPAGTSDPTPTSGNAFTVLGRLSLIPTFQTLTQGGSGDLTVEITTPAPTGGLTVTLTSGNLAVGTLPPTVTIPAGATSALTPVSAVGEGSTTLSAEANGYASAAAAVTVVLPSPMLTGFSPTSGPVGTAVTITGGPFSIVNPTNNTVTFPGPNSTRVLATVTAVTSTQLTTTVPSGAVTGPLQVTTPGGTATSTGHFVVLASPDFTLAVEPLTVPAVQGMTVAVAVRALATGGYTGLTQLTTGPLPPGVTAAFTPARLAPDAAGLLTLTTTGTTPQGLRPIEVRGTAPIGGSAVTRTGTTTLDVQAPGQTLLSGQVRDGEDRPLPGVRITLGGTPLTPLGVTDAAGNFLVAVPVAGPQVVLLDGSPLNTATASYPTIPLTLTIQPGVVTPLGFTPRLQAQPVASLTPILSGQATVLAPPDLPGFRMTIPAGVQVIGWDGQPNTQVSVQAVPLDRSPLPAPPDGLTGRQLYLFSFGKVGGGTPTGIIPIDTPNDLDALPGESVDLYYFNEAPDGTAPNRWEKYGTGTVSPDGSRIVTDVNPATGQPFGIPRFCCGGRMNLLPLLVRPGGGPSGGPGDGGAFAGEPVDTATGFFYLTKTDLVLPGILPLAIIRTYRTQVSDATLFGMPVSGGPFGDGTSWNYDPFLVPPPGGSPDALLLVHPGNRQDLFARQADGTFLNTTSPALRGATVTVDSTGRTLRFKDRTTWRFDLAGRLLAQADRHGNTVTLTRDSQGRITALTDPTGRQVTVTYIGAGLRIDRIQDSLGREVRYTYESGRLSTVTDPNGGVTTYTYDPGGRLRTITDPRGIVFLTNEYDSNGRVLRQTQADGGIWTFAYTATGGFVSQTTVTDPRGNPTTSRFNSSGYLVSQTDALGQTTTLTRAPGSNLLLSTTDPLGRVTRFTYDAQGNVTSITDPLGHVRTFTYEPTFNKVISITDPLGNLTTFEYDAQGNLVAITDPEQDQKPEADRLKTRITYNPLGQPITMTGPLGNTTMFTYDPVGNLVAITDPLGHTTQRTYDAASRLTTQTDPRGKTTRFTYDALNRLTGMTDPLGGLTQFTYDGNGNLLTVTDARGSVTSHTYDGMDRLASRTDPLNRAETFTYDGVGNLVSSTDRKLQTSTFTYDPLNRRTGATFADGAVATFTYDAASRLSLADDTADPHRSTALTYDPLDRLLAEITTLGTVTYRYDPAGRRTQMTVAGQAPVAYSYDAASRLTQLVQEPLSAVTMQYDALGRRTLLTLPNQVSTEYQYDAASRLTALVYRNAPGVLGDLTYRYDAAGNRTSVGGSFARTLLPDPVPSASYDAANQQLAFGNKALTYDANGNLITITEPIGAKTFIWDPQNRLTGVSNGASPLAFAYDAFGRRVTRVADGLTTAFQYSVTDVIRELQPGGEVSYLRGLGPDQTLVQAHRVAYISDAINNTIAVMDATGAIIQEYSYDSFGRTFTAGSLETNRYQYTGRERESGDLYYYRARYYDAGLARFIQPDPLGFLAGVNFYVYVGNSPVNFLDPTGLRTYVVHGIWSGPAAFEDFRLALLNAEPDIRLVEWSGNLLGDTIPTTAEASSNLMRRILRELEQQPLKPGEKLNLIGQSAGGIIVNNAANMLRARGVKVNNLIFMGSPQQFPINAPTPAGTQVTNFVGLFDPLASVFIGGGARNIPVYTGIDPFTAHTSYTTNPTVLRTIQQVIR
jgi:RHS repeat-associated protein